MGMCSCQMIKIGETGHNNRKDASNTVHNNINICTVIGKSSKNSSSDNLRFNNLSFYINAQI